MQPRFPSIAYVPDRFIVVVLSAVLTWRFGWDKQGLEILGTIRSSTGSPFSFRWPLQPSKMIHIQEAMSTSFLIALLGFFESSVAAKSLGTGGSKRLQGMSLSANRELVALGVANIVGGCFMALPAFGGYGRSKVNASTGGKTPMSSIMLSLITIICVLFLLPYFHYLPVGLLYIFAPVPSLTSFPESRPFSHDIRRCLFPYRGSPSRHQVLRSHPWLVGTCSYVPHICRHNILLTAPRYCLGCWPLSPLSHPTLNQTPHTDPRQSTRHARPIRERRRQPPSS